LNGTISTYLNRTGILIDVIFDEIQFVYQNKKKIGNCNGLIHQALDDLSDRERIDLNTKDRVVCLSPPHFLCKSNQLEKKCRLIYPGVG
jgi:pyoverdine/dityrosine biosynthesis protein Dit1